MSLPQPEMKAKVAAFTWIDPIMTGKTFVSAIRTDWEGNELPNEAPSGMVRVSEWQEVEFQPMPRADVTNAALLGLALAREEVVRKFHDQLAAIDGKIAELRALPAPVQS